MTLQVAVGRLAEDEDVKARASSRQGRSEAGQARRSRSRAVGLKLAPLTDELRKKNGIDKDVKGVIVDEVDPASPAAEQASRPAT